MPPRSIKVVNMHEAQPETKEEESAQQQEETTWDQIHQNVINSLIRRIVYSHPLLISPNVTESK